MKKISTLFVCLLSFMALADVKLPSIFSDNAILQRSPATAIYGKAAPGEKVAAVFGNAKAETITGKDGRFSLTLDLSQADDSAKELIITGNNKIVIKNVIVGEVWFCTGQSNMALSIYRILNASDVIRKSANDKIRMFSVARRTARTKQDDSTGQWIIASPATVGPFTAVGYFFAKKINQTTGSAVGLINPSWGGSHIEAWICKDHLDASTPEVKKLADEDLDNFVNYNTYRNKHIEELRAWEKSLGWVDDKKTTAPPENAKWQKAPALGSSFPFPGVVWLRRELDLTPADINNGNINVYIRKIMVETVIYFDGKPVYTVSRQRSVENWPFRFAIPATPGKHTVMMRVACTEPMFHFPGEFSFGKQNCATGWEYCREKVFPAGDKNIIANRPKFLVTRPYENHSPSQIYNCMVHPFIRYTAKGALWYQGESNAGARKGHLYADHITALVKCMRESSGNPEFRFYAVQLPGYRQKNADPNVYGTWPVIRANQTAALKNLPFTAEIITNDTGESNDIHPIDKQPIGDRLAAVALNRDYGRKDIVCDYPQVVKVTKQGSTVNVEYANCHGGLVALKLPETYWVVRLQNRSAKLIPNSPGSQVEGFALCGKDGKWFWANAKIQGNNVIVSSPRVSDPAAIRYACQDNPTCNLFNGANLPAGQFFAELK